MKDEDPDDLDPRSRQGAPLRDTEDGKAGAELVPRRRSALTKALSNESCEEILRDSLLILGASSATFYVRDPWFPTELRLALLPGVRYVEPMYGFVFPSSTAVRVAPHETDGCERYFSSPTELDTLRDSPVPALASLIRKSRLYADFVDREGVRSCSRHCEFGSDGELHSVLWVNFSIAKSFTEDDRADLRALSRRMNEFAPRVVERIRQAHPFPSEQVLRLGSVAEEASGISANPEEYLESVLEMLLQSFGLTPQNGMGAIYIHDPQRQALQRRAAAGHEAIRREDLAVISIGEGVVSWVFLRRRSLLIQDLHDSAFLREGIYIQTTPSVRSVLAVP